MDRVLEALRQIKFKYADRDLQAVEALEAKLVARVRRGEGLISYGELVRGVTFQIPGIKGGQPFEIVEFGDFERGLIGDFLGYINLRSREWKSCLLSTLVELKGEGGPSQATLNWYRPYIDVDPETFWAQELVKVYERYSEEHTRP